MIPGKLLLQKIFDFCHENPLCPFQHILHHFLTEQAAFSILMTLEKNTAAALCGRTEDLVTDKKLISSLQGLRAVAFLSVVLSHCGGTVAGAVGNFRIRGAVRFSDDLQLLRPPAHSTGSAVCHGLFLSKNTQVVSAAPYYDGCCPAPCAEGAPGTALCPWGAVLCSAACGKHFSPANLDSLQPFLVLPERSSVVSFAAGFSVCNLSLASRRAEKRPILADCAVLLPRFSAHNSFSPLQSGRPDSVERPYFT